MEIRGIKIMLMAFFWINLISSGIGAVAEYLGKPETLVNDITYLAAVCCLSFYGIIKAIENNQESDVSR